MSGWFSWRAFTGFGPGRLDPSPTGQFVQAQRAADLRGRIRQDCPRRPGVYGMVNAQGELLYVGKAKCLRSRLLSYFRPGSRNPKAGRIIQHTQTIAWEFAVSEFSALLRELELIRRWRPPFNVQGQPGRRRRTFVCVGRRPAPYVFLSSRPSAGVLACFGPVPAGRKAREAVRRLNDWYRLRDCPHSQEMVFADQGELFPILRAAGCVRYEIRTCLGPCAAACSRAAYAERVQAARAFLSGKDPAPLEVLERDMMAAATAQEFERAGVLRDKLAALHWLHLCLDRLRVAREQHSFVYPVADPDDREFWYLIHRGWVVAVVPAPTDATTRRTAAAALASVFRPGNAAAEPTTTEQIESVLLVAGWFRQHPEELARTRPPAEALQAVSPALSGSEK